MDKVFYTYALITSLYEKGDDYLDCFWPIFIGVLDITIRRNLQYIQEQLKASFELDIPQHVIATLMERARKKGHVAKQKGFYLLTAKGKDFLANLETPRDVDRQINSLIEDVRDYFSENGSDLSHDDLYALFLSFINHNIAPLMEFLHTQKPILITTPESSTRDQTLLVKYLEIAEKQKPECFQTFAKMLLGSILSSIIYTPDPIQMQDIIYRRFQYCEIYLDTNFAFSVLGLHHRELNTAAQELLVLVRKHGCQLKVFDFTVSEICNVVNEYTREAPIYPSTIRIDSINSSLKIMGWTRSKAIEYIANIEQILRENGISIEATGIILKNYIPSQSQHRQIIATYKPNASPLVLNHDLAAIERIRKLRRTSVRRIENAKAIFLSSDSGLSKFDFRELGHQQEGTVAEVILDRLLTNILWLKDPHMKLSLNSVIASHSRGLFINRIIWEKFYFILADLAKAGKAKDSDIFALLYHNYIEDILANYDDEDINDITSTFAIEQIEKARHIMELDRDKAVQEIEASKTAEFTRLLTEQRSRQEYEERIKWLSKLEEIRSNIRTYATRRAGQITTTTRLIVSIVFVGVPIVSYLCTKDWNVFVIFATAISLLVIALSIGFGDLGKPWKAMKRRIINRIYKNKISETGIDKNIPGDTHSAPL